MTAFPRTWCRYGLDDIYAKHAAEAENESDMTWTRRLLTPVITKALTYPSTRANDLVNWTLGEEFDRIDRLRQSKWLQPSPASLEMLAKQDRLIAKAQKLRPDLKFERRGLRGPGYTPSIRTVWAPTTKPEVVAHEMGHSLNDATWRHLFGDKRGLKYPVFLRSKLPRYGQLAGLALMMSKDKDLRDAAPWVTAATSVPKLTGEMLASLRGMKNYRKGLGIKGRIKPYGNLAGALSTYLLTAAAWPLAMWATNRLNDRLYKK